MPFSLSTSLAMSRFSMYLQNRQSSELNTPAQHREEQGVQEVQHREEQGVQKVQQREEQGVQEVQHREEQGVQEVQHREEQGVQEVQAHNTIYIHAYQNG